MDYRSDSSRLAVTCPEPAQRPFASTPATCDQAIFTCIRSAMGQGYRIVAASNGLQRAESSEIAAHAPSGDGLCDNSPQAAGAAFFPLGSGRYAVLHCTYAGKEPTGRGGQRTYTRAVVFDADTLGRSRNNPFAVLRAAEAAGVLNADLAPNKSLPQVTLSINAQPGPQCIATAMDQIGDGWIAHCIDKLLSNETLVVAAQCDPLALTETVLLAIPLPLRPSISFSAGVRFSIGRVGRFNVIGGEGARAQQAVRGRALAFADLTGTRTPPRPAGHPWALLAQRLLGTCRADRLIALSSSQFAEADVATIERIGNACLDLDNVNTADAAEVIDTAAAYIERPVASPLGEDLSRQIVNRARSRLDSMISAADETALTALWRELGPSLRQSNEGAVFGTEVVRLAISRMSRLAPLRAMDMTMDAAKEGWFARSHEELDRIAGAVLGHVAMWASSAPAAELVPARQKLAEWRRRFPDDAAAAAIAARIDK